MQFQFAVQDNDLVTENGPLTFGVSVESIPVTLITHTNQEKRAVAGILWHKFQTLRSNHGQHVNWAEGSTVNLKSDQQWSNAKARGDYNISLTLIAD